MLLGHRSIRTTVRYTRVTDKHLVGTEGDCLQSTMSKKVVSVFPKTLDVAWMRKV
jgi:site-specific recombinase XerD